MSNMLALNSMSTLLIVGAGLVLVCALILFVILFKFGALWIQAYMSGADVTFLSLIGMSLRRVKPGMIVTAKVMGRQAGLSIDRHDGMATDDLEAHALAGGNVMRVISAIIAARQAGMDLDFDRAAAMDLAGRDVLDAVRTSISPKAIDCPESGAEKTWLSAIAIDGIELRIHARVTVRTCLDQLVGGATEETIIARVGQGIISAVGSAKTYAEVLSLPDQVSKAVLKRGLDTNTAFEIVSIDIAEIDIGNNIGARLQTEKAEADTRMAQAAAETRRAEAIALKQEMRASVTKSRAALILAEAEIPAALANAFRTGQFATNNEPQADIFPRIRRSA